MDSPLERLAELVRQAESKSRAQKLGTEARQAAERLRLAEERARLVERRVSELRPARQRDLAKAESDEALLKDLIRKLAHTVAGLGPEQQKEAERDITAAQEEIQHLRQRGQTELEAIAKESESARQELRVAREQYHHLRREIDQLLPELAAEFAQADRLIKDTEQLFPEGQVQALAREVEDGERHYSMLESREQFAQLKIWVGRFRRMQAWVEMGTVELDESAQAQLREIFPRLVGISKQYMPGYIEAFSRSFETDWDSYVGEATDQLRQATELARRDRDRDLRRREPHVREPERPRVSPRPATLNSAEEGEPRQADPRVLLDQRPVNPARSINGASRQAAS